jgi:hypothetical protein
MEYLGKEDTLLPVLMDNWYIVPEKPSQDALRSDRRLLEKELGF